MKKWSVVLRVLKRVQFRSSRKCVIIENVQLLHIRLYHTQTMHKHNIMLSVFKHITKVFVTCLFIIVRVHGGGLARITISTIELIVNLCLLNMLFFLSFFSLGMWDWFKFRFFNFNSIHAFLGCAIYCTAALNRRANQDRINVFVGTTVHVEFEGFLTNTHCKTFLKSFGKRIDLSKKKIIFQKHCKI